MTAWIVRALVVAHFALLAAFDIATVATVFTVEAAALALAFVARFSRVTWHRTGEGRHLLAFTLLVALFMTFAAAVRIFGAFPGYRFVALGLYGLLVALLWDRNLLLWNAQHEDDDENRNPR